MSSAKQFSETVLDELRSAGWSRRGTTAWIRGVDGDVVVNLQKSNYDLTVFVNVGVALHTLGHPEPPRYVDCHLQFRVDRLLESFPSAGTGDLEELRTEVRSNEAALRALGDLEELGRRFAAGGLTRGLVRKEARELLARQG